MPKFIFIFRWLFVAAFLLTPFLLVRWWLDDNFAAMVTAFLFVLAGYASMEATKDDEKKEEEE
jgi:hypothetical protein